MKRLNNDAIPVILCPMCKRGVGPDSYNDMDYTETRYNYIHICRAALKAEELDRLEMYQAEESLTVGSK